MNHDTLCNQANAGSEPTIESSPVAITSSVTKTMVDDWTAVQPMVRGSSYPRIVLYGAVTALQ